MSRLGLQKRIMLYVATGLTIMFAFLYYVGAGTVNRGTELVLAERLAIAQSVAAALARDFDHVIRDTEEEMGGLVPASDRTALEAAVEEVLIHIGRVGVFAFFIVSGVWLLDADGQPLASTLAESSRAVRPVLPTSASPTSGGDAGAYVFSPEDGASGDFVSIVIPLTSPEGDVWARTVVNTVGISSSESFVPFGFLGVSPDDGHAVTEDLPQQVRYYLDVLTRSGVTVLGIGPDEQVGHESEHYPLIKAVMDNRESVAMLHDAAETSQLGEHVIAVVPVPLSDLYLVLEQDTDTALALPNEFRRRLVLFGSLGFVVALVVAWVTTRHVVKPIEVLTTAAARMAEGELSTPIRVLAQDEVGVLAEKLEIMRQQLRSALDEAETANRELESRVKERTRQLQELIGRVLTAQEEERRRVALELHDETAQALTALIVTLDSVVRRSDHLTPEEYERLREVRQTAADTLDGLRRLIYALRPVALDDMGLAAALRWHAEDHLDQQGLTVHVTAEGPERDVPDHVELTLYRIGQEALNNVFRHAGAENAWVTIAYRDSLASMTVRDDGAGFDPGTLIADSQRLKGIGLAGMRERASLVGGRLSIESAPGEGTTVRVEVPVTSDE